MKTKGYETQQRIKDTHREKILTILKDGSQRFSFLQKSTGHSPGGLAKILDDLIDGRLITKTVQNKRLVYSLTKKGRREFEEVFLLSNVLSQIKSRGGKYLSGGVPLQQVKTEPLFWPTSIHMAADKEIDNILQIIPKEYLLGMQFALNYLMARNIKKKKIQLNEKLEKQIVLGIQIEYSDLVKMIKNNSLTKWKELWEKEGEINTIWLQDSISADRGPYISKHKLKGSLAQ